MNEYVIVQDKFKSNHTEEIFLIDRLMMFEPDNKPDYNMLNTLFRLILEKLFFSVLKI